MAFLALARVGTPFSMDFNRQGSLRMLGHRQAIFGPMNFGLFIRREGGMASLLLKYGDVPCEANLRIPHYRCVRLLTLEALKIGSIHAVNLASP